MNIWYRVSEGNTINLSHALQIKITSGQNAWDETEGDTKFHIRANLAGHGNVTLKSFDNREDAVAELDKLTS